MLKQRAVSERGEQLGKGHSEGAKAFHGGILLVYVSPQQSVSGYLAALPAPSYCWRSFTAKT